MTKVTGWDNGLCQDYDKGLGRWLANRLGARQQLRQDFKMTQLITVDRATLEQLVAALNEVDQHVDLKRYDTAPNEVLFDVVMEAMVKGRAASSQPTDDNCQGIIDTSIRAASSTALTDAWIRERTKQPWVFDTVKQWVREIEAAHGIGRKPCS